MPFDRAGALKEADDKERELQVLYSALGVPFLTMKLLDSALVVRCEEQEDVREFCALVAKEYRPRPDLPLNS